MWAQLQDFWWTDPFVNLSLLRANLAIRLNQIVAIAFTDELTFCVARNAKSYDLMAEVMKENQFDCALCGGGGTPCMDSLGQSHRRTHYHHWRRPYDLTYAIAYQIPRIPSLAGIAGTLSKPTSMKVV